MIWIWIAFIFFFIIEIAGLILCGLNQKKIRRKYKFDTIPIYLFVYIVNVLTILGIVKGGTTSLIITTVIMAFVIIKCSKLQIIGLTGGIGCGKSTVSKMLNQDFRFPIIDCDILARKVVEVGMPAYNEVVGIFGTGILDQQTKEINRKALGELVFNNEPMRKKLTRTTGKYIMLEIFKELFRAVCKGQDIIVLDAPLLFESMYLPYFCYPTVVVYISESSIQIKRIVERDKMTIEEAQKRINSQMPIGKKLQLADVKIGNDGDVDALKGKILNELGSYLV